MSATAEAPKRAGKALTAACCALAGVLNALATLGTSILVARALAPAGVGFYGLATWWLTIAVTAAMAGHGTSTMKFLSEALGRGDPDGARAVVAHGARRVLRNAMLLVALLLVVLPKLRGPSVSGAPLVIAWPPTVEPARLAGELPCVLQQPLHSPWRERWAHEPAQAQVVGQSHRHEVVVGRRAMHLAAR